MQLATRVDFWDQEYRNHQQPRTIGTTAPHNSDGHPSRDEVTGKGTRGNCTLDGHESADDHLVPLECFFFQTTFCSQNWMKRENTYVQVYTVLKLFPGDFCSNKTRSLQPRSWVRSPICWLPPKVCMSNQINIWLATSFQIPFFCRLFGYSLAKPTCFDGQTSNFFAANNLLSWLVKPSSLVVKRPFLCSNPICSG